MHCQRKHPYFDICYSSLTQYLEIGWFKGLFNDLLITGNVEKYDSTRVLSE